MSSDNAKPMAEIDACIDIATRGAGRDRGHNVFEASERCRILLAIIRGGADIRQIEKAAMALMGEKVTVLPKAWVEDILPVLEYIALEARKPERSGPAEEGLGI